MFNLNKITIISVKKQQKKKKDAKVLNIINEEKLKIKCKFIKE